MSEAAEGGSLLNSLKVKLLEEQKELQELRLNVEKYQDELKTETEKRTEVNGGTVIQGPIVRPRTKLAGYLVSLTGCHIHVHDSRKTKRLTGFGFTEL